MNQTHQFRNKILAKTTFGVLAVWMLGGCMKLGPDFTGIQNPPLPKAWEHSSLQDDRSVAQWWKTFHDPTLSLLVEKTYAQNLDLKAAGLRILQARAILGISEGLMFPQVQTLSGSASSSKNGGNDIATAGVNFDLGWELDIWGKYARGIESSEADVYASIASHHDIMVSVIAEVARNYIEYRTSQERIAYAKRNIVIQERVTQLTEVQFNTGNVSELDMQQARSQLYNTRAAIPAIEFSKSQALNAMAYILASDAHTIKKILDSNSHTDNASVYISQKNKEVIQLSQSDAGSLGINIIPQAKLNPYNKIDAALLLRRPDIKVAEYKARSANAQIGSSIAALYPSFSLFGNIGYNTNNARGSWLSGSDALGVSVGPSFSWNIFHYDRIKNQIRLQDALFEESLVNYNKSVLSAVSEVSNALEGHIWIQSQQVEIKKAVDATVRAFNISVIQYNDGLVGYERLLDTVEKLTTTQDRYATIKGNLSLQTIALYKALGGGWQISQGKSYLSTETAARMKVTVDWGRYLDANMTQIPKGIQ
ncbi:MAG TPA: TolC family protein [Sulfurovum sp.]|nr:MAG: hypothetical protein B7Y63_02935 [Sulfurovum sp. 35-42-20]OYY57262.1 MAG: hypothetical protein B7Y52_01735 [Sulfurovum sp. 28-43-6]OYZ25023.1 MAG: hypothetical protein B7Y23_07250 [Sulfurovum sp. 16-42-52]OYZ49384.1 MAG: hypothetical protein B7Y13_04730 [Sulfurovum sp. 24-42-9]OZA45022.1 MAG: hypothetical protein B7X80_06290 [Sulfurovum sp. 17-42-90]OZA59756.1 MAG: hypothetical protein B7X69_06775 [Sulfurovum sp. 39-42-12]HQR73839.1 TolC family protein [Sulfurovum sp.]